MIFFPLSYSPFVFYFFIFIFSYCQHETVIFDNHLIKALGIDIFLLIVQQFLNKMQQEHADIYKLSQINDKQYIYLAYYLKSTNLL